MRHAAARAPQEPIAAAVASLLEGADGGLSRHEREQLAWVEGLLTAAAIGPERSYPHEWAQIMYGAERTYADAEMVQASVGVLVLMHNDILAGLRSLRADFEPRFLEFAEEGEQVTLAAAWAEGFMNGMRLRGEAWRKLIDSGQGRRSLSPIAVYLPGVLDHLSSAEKMAAARRDSLEWLGTCVFEMFEFWRVHSARSRRADADPFRKIGRNEPCPCGSGRKHKKCCLDGLD